MSVEHEDAQLDLEAQPLLQLPVGWICNATHAGKEFVSVLDEVAVQLDPRGLPPGWVARAHKTLGMIYANADDLLAGRSAWTLIDPRGLSPTNVSLRVDQAGRASFIDLETNLPSYCDPRWNVQVSALGRRTFLRFDFALNTSPSAQLTIDYSYATLQKLIEKGYDVDTAFLIANAADHEDRGDQICWIQSHDFVFDEEIQWLLDTVQAMRNVEYYSGGSDTEGSDRDNAFELPLLVGHFIVKGNNTTVEADSPNKAFGGSRTVKLTRGCLVFGYVKNSLDQFIPPHGVPNTCARLRILAPFKGVVSSKNMLKFERIMQPQRRTSAEIRRMLNKFPLTSVNASRIRSLHLIVPRTHFLSADSDASDLWNKSNLREYVISDEPVSLDSKDVSPRMQLSVAEPIPTATESIVTSIAQAWAEADLRSNQLQVGRQRTFPLTSTAVSAEGRNSFGWQKRSAADLWNILKRGYKISAQRMAIQRIQEAEKELEEAFLLYEGALRDSLDLRTCKVCWDNSVNITCMDCGHQCLCSGCAIELETCPMCMQPVSEFRRTIFGDASSSPDEAFGPFFQQTSVNMDDDHSNISVALHEDEDAALLWKYVCTNFNLAALDTSQWCTPESLLDGRDGAIIDSLRTAARL